MISEEDQYHRWQQAREIKWESLCGRCGACCGAVDGDPCEHLIGNARGNYSCSIYENRFGMHKTISGKPLECVPIRQILNKSWPGDECCGYKKEIKRFIP